MNIRIHRFAPSYGVSGKKQKSPKTLDLIKLKVIVRIAYFDSIFLDQKWDKIATILVSIALNAANFVKE